MKASGHKSLPVIGFLTVTRDAEHGLFGGYLVLNALGRPVEFHCTAPVRPNRAQEILYGPTLEPFLFGERIGRTLLEKAKSSPQLVLTDVEPVMAARPLVTLPMALVIDPAHRDTLALSAPTALDEVSATSSQVFRCDSPHPLPDPSSAMLQLMQVGDYPLAVVTEYPEDVQRVNGHWPEFESRIDLGEPFSRIREAIGEARNSVR